MRVLLFEQWWGGHHSNYLECLVPRLAGLSSELVLAVHPKVLESRIAVEDWSSRANVRLVPATPTPGPSLRFSDRRLATANLLRSLDDVRPDVTLIPSADAQATLLSMRRAMGTDLLAGRGDVEATFHYGYGDAASTAKERAKEWVYGETYRRAPFSRLNFVNFAYHDHVVRRRLVLPERLRFVGDPVPQSAPIGRRAARDLLGLDPDGFYFGILGSLDARKAIPPLLAAFREAALPRDHRLLLGGRLAPQHAEVIRTGFQDLIAEGRLVVIDRFLSDEELRHGYEALDVATIVYERFPGLASLGLKAVAAGTPLIAHDFGWLRAAVRRFGIGRCTDIFDTATFARTLREACERPPVSPWPEAVRRLLRFHREDNFVSLMCEGVALKAGRPPPEPIVEWSWVLDALPPERRDLV